MGLGLHLLSDFLYEQNPDDSYITDEDGGFKKKNLNIVYDILEILKEIYTNKFGTINVREGFLLTDLEGLNQAFRRYSRDIYGQKRLQTRIENTRSMFQNDKDKLIEAIEENEDFGFKISSLQPDFYRKVSYFLYWFSVLKPFNLDLTKINIEGINPVIRAYFNEHATYSLVKIAISVYQFNNKIYKLDVDKNESTFEAFLYDLHFRNLSRSSLEFFLRDHMVC